MKKTNTIIIAAAFLLVGCMFAHVGCIPYDPSMMESYWGAQSGGNSIFDNDANNWNGSAGESLFQTPNNAPQRRRIIFASSVYFYVGASRSDC